VSRAWWSLIRSLARSLSHRSLVLLMATRGTKHTPPPLLLLLLLLLLAVFISSSLAACTFKQRNEFYDLEPMIRVGRY